MLVSVITPVYNTEKYLDECIGSILSQSMTDFELLLIDDGSTDGSGAICDRYAEKDKRIRVFHIPNGGVSAAEISDWTTHGANSWSSWTPTTGSLRTTSNNSPTAISERTESPSRTCSKSVPQAAGTPTDTPGFMRYRLPGHGRPGCLHARTGAAAAQTLPRLDLQQNVLARHDRTARPALRPQHPIRRRRDIHGPVLRPYHPPRQQQQPHIPLPVRPHESAARKDRPDDADAHTPLHPRTVPVAGLLRRDTLPHDPGRSFRACAANCAGPKAGTRASQRVGGRAYWTTGSSTAPTSVRNSARDSTTRKPCGSPG